MTKQEIQMRYRASGKKNDAKRIRREANREWLNSLKSAPCTDCAKVYPPECMDYDHLPGADKTAGVAMVMRSWSRERTLKEIAKCELVCANCHRIRTSARINASRF